MENQNKIKSVSYAKWGYIFILPFFLSYAIFSLIPLADTIRNSFYEYYAFGLKTVGPNWTGLSNYISLLSSDLPKYAWNTFVMWVLGFVPQIIISLILASWFTDARLKIRGKQFFKVVIYLPNLIMASAFAMLFFALFSNAGPINSILLRMGVIGEAIRFMESTLDARTLVGLMNFLMWFGNTTIMLMAAIMGINPSIFKAAELDGCTHIQQFFKITLPQILTAGKGAPDRTHAQLQLGFSALPGSSFLTNFQNVINDPAIPILKGIQNSLIVSGCCAAFVTYFSALTAYGIYAHDFRLKHAAFTFIMAIWSCLPR